MTMAKLNSAEDAIEQAIAGGLVIPQQAKEVFAEIVLIQLYLTDPLFWQALGKVRDWTKMTCEICGTPYVDIRSCQCGDQSIPVIDTAEFHAARWFDIHVWHPDQETKFWQSLP